MTDAERSAVLHDLIRYGQHQDARCCKLTFSVHTHETPLNGMQEEHCCECGYESRLQAYGGQT